MQQRSRRAVMAIGLTLAVAVPAMPAEADVTASRNAKRVARAMVSTPSMLRNARWVKLPPQGNPAAISTTSLVGFPRSRRSFVVLSTGDATLIDDPNEVEDLSTDNGGDLYRGTSDSVVLRVDLRRPRRARCLSVAFRFLSEEYDEFVDTEFNDAFLIEQRRSTWRSDEADPVISAPNNFAFDRGRTPISVNGTGDFSVTPERAARTTYDGGTRRLRASRRLRGRSRRVRVYFSIFDQGDRQYDSSVVIDALTVSRRRPCVSGAALD